MFTNSVLQSFYIYRPEKTGEIFCGPADSSETEVDIEKILFIKPKTIKLPILASTISTAIYNWVEFPAAPPEKFQGRQAPQTQTEEQKLRQSM